MMGAATGYYEWTNIRLTWALTQNACNRDKGPTAARREAGSLAPPSQPTLT